MGLRAEDHSALSKCGGCPATAASHVGDGQRDERLSLTRPHGAEQKTKRQRQRQGRVGSLLEGLVDRNSDVVADFAHRLDGVSSLVLRVGNDTSDISDITAGRHGLLFVAKHHLR